MTAEITIDNWHYRPRSAAPSLPPGWEEALDAAGFQPVGGLERRLPPLPAHASLPVVDVPRWQPPRPETLAVWRSADGRAFAVLEPYFEELLLSLRTLAATGEVVETTVASRRPAARPPETLTATIFSGRWLTRPFRRGPQPETEEEGERGAVSAKDGSWIRADRPGAGYHLELVPVDPEAAPETVVATLWARHRERLAALLPGPAIPRHDDLARYLALLLRSAQVAAAVEARLARLDTLATYLLGGLGLLLGVALPFFLLGRGGLGAPGARPLTWVGGALLLLMVAAYLLHGLLRRHWVARPLPPVPAAELLARVRRGEGL